MSRQRAKTSIWTSEWLGQVMGEGHQQSAFWRKRTGTRVEGGKRRRQRPDDDPLYQLNRKLDRGEELTSNSTSRSTLPLVSSRSISPPPVVTWVSSPTTFHRLKPYDPDLSRLSRTTDLLRRNGLVSEGFGLCGLELASVEDRGNG